MVDTATLTSAPEPVVRTTSPDTRPAGMVTASSVALFEAGSTASLAPGNMMVLTSSMFTPLNLIASPSQRSVAGSATTSSGMATPMVAAATLTPDAGMMQTVPSVTLAGRMNVSTLPLTVNSTSSSLGMVTLVTRSRLLPLISTVWPGLAPVRSSTLSTVGRATVISSSEYIQLGISAASLMMTLPDWASAGTRSLIS